MHEREIKGQVGLFLTLPASIYSDTIRFCKIKGPRRQNCKERLKAVQEVSAGIVYRQEYIDIKGF